jgi:hypothetical protein
MKLIVQRWGSGAVRAQQGMGSRRGISSIGGRLPPRTRAMVSGTCPATGSNHGRAYRAPKAKVKLTPRLCDCLVSSPSQDQDRFAAVAKISTTLRIVHVGDAALVECLGSVLEAVVYVFDPTLFGPSVSSGAPDTIICTVIAA